jgi:hypothetical protein
MQLDRSGQLQSGKEIRAQHITRIVLSEIDPRWTDQRHEQRQRCQDEVPRPTALPGDQYQLEGESKERCVLDHMARRKTVVAQVRRYVDQLAGRTHAPN